MAKPKILPRTTGKAAPDREGIPAFLTPEVNEFSVCHQVDVVMASSSDKLGG